MTKFRSRTKNFERTVHSFQWNQNRLHGCDELLCYNSDNASFGHGRKRNIQFGERSLTGTYEHDVEERFWKVSIFYGE